MKPSRHSAMQREIVSGEASIFTPSSLSTSAEPEREEIARLPCLATGHPGAGHHESRTGRDVEGALAVAASAASVDGALRRAHGQHLGPHRAGSAGDLVHGLAANAHAPSIGRRSAPESPLPTSSSSKASAASSWLRLLPDATLAIAPRKSVRIAVPASAGLEGTDRFSWPSALARRSTRARSRKLARS